MIRAGTPFVLLDDARPGGGATLFRSPRSIVRADSADEVKPALAAVRAGVAGGVHAAGWIGYEAGHALEAKLAPLAGDADAPLLWFGLFDRAEAFDCAALPDGGGAWAGPPRPLIGQEDHAVAVARVLALIAAGDIYQANLSFRAAVRVMGDPLALYARLRAAGGGAWSGIAHDGTDWLLSFSPECFFRIDGSAIAARPMKGTRPRGFDAAEDAALAEALATDPKDRAENLMIVDLMRNDLSRIAAPGSVRVPALFAVETYPTVHQMVSEVQADLAPGRDAIDAIAALFPCGSVTGAPKLRAMEVIARVEADKRGAYTGSIGFIAPDGCAAFNVAIRTLRLEEGSDEAIMGLGSAIVADSDPAAEWAECLAKGAFVTAPDCPFDLIETMRFEPEEGIVNLDAHIERLRASAAAFDIPFDRHGVRNELHAATFRLNDLSRVRLRVSPGGAVAIEAGPYPPPLPEPIAVRVVPLPLDPRDPRLRHKTSDRRHYDRARAEAGTEEVVFVRPDGLLTEGSFTNLFVPRDGRLVTPPVESGLMPGIRRAALIESGEAVEGDLTAADLCADFYVANDLRGMVRARLI